MHGFFTASILRIVEPDVPRPPRVPSLANISGLAILIMVPDERIAST